MRRAAAPALVTCAAFCSDIGGVSVMRLRVVTGALLLCLVLIGGCSRERIDWKSAEAADTQEAYNHFLELHPSGELATQARARLTQLVEDKDWQRTIAADTPDAYKQFLAQHPGGKWAEEARIRVESFGLDTHPSPTGDTASTSSTASSTTASSTTAAPGTPAKPPAAPSVARTAPAQKVSPPVTPPAANAAHAADSASAARNGAAPPTPSVPSPKDSPGFGIQLGAFSTQSAALSEWKRLQVKFDPQLHGLFAHTVPAQVASGKVFRLQSPVGDESRARSICAALSKQAQPCVVVLPNAQ
jgi:cell division protein FtsN